MQACAVICRKATVARPGANPYPFEHKIGIFVLFLPSEPPFSGISSTKSRFLCQNGRFFRDFGRFEHKIGLFVHGGAVMLVVFADLSMNCGT